MNEHYGDTQRQAQAGKQADTLTPQKTTLFSLPCPWGIDKRNRLALQNTRRDKKKMGGKGESTCTHTSAPPHLEKVGGGGSVRVAERTGKAERPPAPKSFIPSAPSRCTEARDPGSIFSHAAQAFSTAPSQTPRCSTV